MSVSISKARKEQKKLTERSLDAAINNVKNQMSVFDLSDKQNELLRNDTLSQAERKAENEWNKANAQLQSAANYLNGSMSNSSTVPSYLQLLNRQNDISRATVLDDQQSNIDAANNALTQAMNANRQSRADVAASGQKGAEDSLASNVASYINLGGDAKFYDKMAKKYGIADNGLFEKYANLEPYKAPSTGYIMPADAQRKSYDNQAKNNNKGNAKTTSSYYNALIS